MQQSYRNYPQATPGFRKATFRKSGPQTQNSLPQSTHRPSSNLPPHTHAPHSQATAAASEWAEQRQRAQDEHDQRRRRSQKPVDRNIPPGVLDLVKNNDDVDRYGQLKDGVTQYTKLREVERRLDAVMTRKRLDALDNVPGRGCERGIMRIWISNTAEGQPWQLNSNGLEGDTFEWGGGGEASFRVKIEGRLVPRGDDDEKDLLDEAYDNKEKDGDIEMSEGAEPAAKRPRLSSTTAGVPGQKTKLSHFFKAISIDFDRAPALQPDQYTRIQWQRPDTLQQPLGDQTKGQDFDCLEFQRKSDENINITINLTRDEEPQHYKLAPQLAELLDIEEADRQTALMGVWEYIRSRGLADESEGRHVRCDSRLQRALSTETFFVPHLPELLRPVMFDPLPLTLPYTIRVDKDFHNSGNTTTPKCTIYDIPVSLPSPLRTSMTALLNHPKHAPNLRQLNRTDDDLALVIQAMAHAKAKHTFFKGMSKDPASFVKRWIESQRRDLGVILGAGAGNLGDEDLMGPEWRRGGGDSGPWGSAQVAEGIGTYLGRLDKTARAST